MLEGFKKGWFGSGRFPYRDAFLLAVSHIAKFVVAGMVKYGVPEI